MAVTTPQKPAPAAPHDSASHGGTVTTAKADWRDPRYQAFAMLRIAFTIVPIAFGIDKFANILVDARRRPSSRSSRSSSAVSIRSKNARRERRAATSARARLTVSTLVLVPSSFAAAARA